MTIARLSALTKNLVASMPISTRPSRVRAVAAGFVTAGLFVLGAPAQAYFSTIDTGDVVPKGAYQAGIEAQGIMNNHPGVNAVGRFDTGLDDGSGVRGVLGFGKVDFQVGGFYKTVPFPDTPSQPAMGLDAGVLIAHANNESEVSLRLHPLISKRLVSDFGDLTPYGSIPFGVTFANNGSFVPSQFVVGGELRPLNAKNLSLFAELGLQMTHSFSYISLAMAYRFDGPDATHVKRGRE